MEIILFLYDKTFLTAVILILIYSGIAMLYFLFKRQLGNLACTCAITVVVILVYAMVSSINKYEVEGRRRRDEENRSMNELLFNAQKFEFEKLKLQKLNNENNF